MGARLDAAPARPASAVADWRRHWPEPRRRRLRAWLWAVALATCAVLVVGGVTRLTRSGLSIVQWQPLMGAVPPLGVAAWESRFHDYQQFPEFRQVRPTMTLSEFKVIFFWEYLHRLLARGIGLVVLLPLIAFWRAGDLTPALARRVLGLVALGLAQGAMGWLMVRSGLVDRPSVSHYRLALHLCLAFAIFGYAVWLARELAVGAVPPVVGAAAKAGMARALVLVGIVLAAQIVWGAFVAGLKAGHVLNTFPLMAGRLVPPQLVVFDPPLLNAVQNAIAVQWLHRLLGTALVAVAWLVAWRVRRVGADARSIAMAHRLAAAITAQYALGVATLVLDVPTVLAASHQAAALAVAGIWVAWAHHVHTLAVAPSAAR
jgi:cytochrome c oxidase assembly protein subunit 15